VRPPDLLLSGVEQLPAELDDGVGLPVIEELLDDVECVLESDVCLLVPSRLVGRG
jgi:hypothetical protein